MKRFTYQSGKIIASEAGEYVLFSDVETIEAENKEYQEQIEIALITIEEQENRVETLAKTLDSQRSYIDFFRRDLEKERIDHNIAETHKHFAIFAAIVLSAGLIASVSIQVLQ